MKRLLVLLMILTGFVFAQVPEDWTPPSELTFEEIEFSPPEPTRAELSNGIVVYLLEDPTLPLVEGVALVNAPNILDPADKVGLANLTASLLREGGAGELSPEALNERLEGLAAAVETSASRTSASIGFSTLTENVAEVLPIWRDVMVNPNFDEERLEVERGLILEDIRRENDDPFQVAAREFLFRVAEGHPYGYYTTEETVNAVERADIIDFHARYYQPSATVVAVTGDFDTDDFLAELETVLGSWTGEAVDYPDLPPFDPDPEPKIYHAQKDVTQSIIIVGEPTVSTYTPEYNDLDVANQILGRGFSSRLTTEIRTRRGLAYSTASGLTTGYDYPGTFYALALTNAEDTAQVIDLILGEVERLREDEVGESELEQRRETILNRALFRSATPADIVENRASAELFGLEPDYYEQYLENVQQITPEEVQAIMQQEVNPEDFIIMVVGDAAQFDRPLEELGEVVEIELE